MNPKNQTKTQKKRMVWFWFYMKTQTGETEPSHTDIHKTNNKNVYVLLLIRVFIKVQKLTDQIFVTSVYLANTIIN